MAKGETKKTNKMLDTQMATQNKNFGDFNATQSQRSNDAYGRSNEVYQKLLEGYGGLAGGTAGLAGGGGGGWALPSTYGDIKAGYTDFTKTGGIDADKIRGAGHSTMEEISKTGGFDPAATGRIQGDIAALRQFGQTGGIDAAAQARMRGGGVFDEFARTGGISDSDARNIRARGNAPISAAFGAGTAEMNRARRISGGSASMGNAAALKMARERSRASAEAALSTELGLSDRIRSGRQFGAEGMASSEGNLQGQLNSNRLAGMSGALGGEMNFGNAVAGNRLQGAGMWNQSEAGIQDMTQRGKLAGLGGLESVAGAEASAAASNASIGSSNARYADAMRLEGLEGLSRLRGQAPGEVGMYDENLLRGIGGQAGAANEGIGMRYQAPGNNRSAWDTATNLLGAGAGLAGAFMTGGATTAAGAGAARGIAPQLAGAAAPMLSNDPWKRIRFTP